MKKRKKGLSLVEIIVAASLTMAGMVILTQLLWNVSSSTNRQMRLDTLQSKNRLVVNTLEREIASAQQVVIDSTDYNDKNGVTKTAQSDGNTLVLQIPIYTENKFIGIDDSNNTLLFDTIILKKEDDSESFYNRLDNTGKRLKRGTLKYTVIKHLKSERQSFSEKVLHNSLMPNQSADPITLGNTNYFYPNNIVIPGPDQTGLFTYYDSDGTQINNNFDNAAMVKVTLWAEDEYKDRSLTQKKDILIKIRNYTTN